MPGLEQRDRRVVVDRVGVQRTNDTQIVGDGAEVGQQFAQPQSALTVLAKFIATWLQGETGLTSNHAGDALAFAYRIRQILIEAFIEFRFGIEEIEVRRTTGLERADHPFGFRRKMRNAGDARRGGTCGRRDQRTERSETDSVGRTGKQGAAGWVYVDLCRAGFVIFKKYYPKCGRVYVAWVTPNNPSEADGRDSVHLK